MALSDERLEKYRYRKDREAEDYGPPLARYAWNVALCAVMYPVLHLLEITLRNALYNAIAEQYPAGSRRYIDVPCWLDFERPILYAEEWEKVQAVKGKLRERRQTITPGRLIAGLDFGFWIGLMRGDYENRRRSSCPDIWPQIMTRAFPHRPVAVRTREQLFQRFHAIKELRNRVFHHEPIWDRPNLAQEHRQLIATINWMSQAVAEAIEDLSPFRTIYHSHIAPYEPAIREARRRWS